MKCVTYKDLQTLADGESEVEARRGHIVKITMGGNIFRFPHFIDMRMKAPDNPSILITDTTDAIQYSGYLQDARKEKWFSTYQAAFEPEAEWWVRD